jgi:hypothetical protein
MSEEMIFPWVRRREPSSNNFLGLVAYHTISVFPDSNGEVKI